MGVQPSLRDPATGQIVWVLGLGQQHRIVISHRARLPALDVPGKQGDSVQYLGRKSRLGRVQRGVSSQPLLPVQVQPGLLIVTPLNAGSVIKVNVAEVKVVSPEVRALATRLFAEALVGGARGPVGGLQAPQLLAQGAGFPHVADPAGALAPVGGLQAISLGAVSGGFPKVDVNTPLGGMQSRTSITRTIATVIVT